MYGYVYVKARDHWTWISIGLNGYWPVYCKVWDVSLFQILVLNACTSAPSFLCVYWESELRSSCLRDKHFTDRTIFPEPTGTFSLPCIYWQTFILHQYYILMNISVASLLAWNKMCCDNKTSTNVKWFSKIYQTVNVFIFITLLYIW